MKERYFKKLKSHPGLEVAAMITIMGCFAGASNKSMSWETGLLFGAITTGVVSFGIVLISNFKR